MRQKIFFIYKITNNVNQKCYVGQHYGFPDDGYMGSGKIIKQAIAKYGLDSFSKQIIETCKNKDETNQKEKFWINECKSLVPNGYNITIGGNGGNTLTNHPDYLKIRQKMKDHHSDYWKGRHHTEETKTKIKLHHHDVSKENHPSWGLKRSEETRKKIGEKSKLKKGYIHIYNPQTGERKCHMDPTKPIPEGFIKGFVVPRYGPFVKKQP